MGRDNVLFTFPSVSLAHPHASSASGFLVLSSSSRPTEHDPRSRETHLRLQHTPESKGNSTDVEIEAWRELRKISPREFVLGTEFGDLSIKFPELHHLIPQNDARIDLPTEVKREMTWEGIVREFESEVDHFVSYKKNTYSLIDSPFSGTAAASEKGGMEKSRGYESGKHHGYESGKSHGYNSEKGHGYESEKGKRIDNDRALQAYDPSNFRAGDEKRGGGRLVLVDEENGHEVGEVRGSQVDSIGVVPGSKGQIRPPSFHTYVDESSDRYRAVG